MAADENKTEVPRTDDNAYRGVDINRESLQAGAQQLGKKN